MNPIPGSTFRVECRTVLSRSGRFDVLQCSTEKTDPLASNRKVLILAPGMGTKERVAFLAVAYRHAGAVALGKLPHHVPHGTDSIAVTGPGYAAVYRVRPLLWEEDRRGTVPLSVDALDTPVPPLAVAACGGQSYQMNVLTLESPWLPMEKSLRRMPWRGYSPLEPLPSGLTFDEAREVEAALALSIRPVAVAVQRSVKKQGRKVVAVHEEQTLLQTGQIVIPHGWQFAVAVKKEL
jgi:hypothetical protein